MKKKRLWMEFIKDQAGHTLVYILACSALILFYQIMTHHTMEVLYPVGLATGIYLIYMVGAYVIYVMTIRKFSRMLHHSAGIEEFYQERDKRIGEIINQIHHEYAVQMMEQKEEKQTELNMISAWVHSMKTPVTVTNLILQRIKNQEMDPCKSVAELQNENQKILGLLDNILNMIRLQEFEKDYVPQAIDLEVELTHLINSNKSLFIQNRVYPKFNAPEAPVMVLADTKWNSVMLQQLISNAVKYSRVCLNGEETSYVEFAVQNIPTSSGIRTELTIQDHGIGIPEYDLNRVFDLFFTGENGRKVEQSSGIGLYFAKEICQMFGAQISLISTLGKGTTVSIRYLTKS